MEFFVKGFMYICVCIGCIWWFLVWVFCVCFSYFNLEIVVVGLFVSLWVGVWVCCDVWLVWLLVLYCFDMCNCCVCFVCYVWVLVIVCCILCNVVSNELVIVVGWCCCCVCLGWMLWLVYWLWLSRLFIGCGSGCDCSGGCLCIGCCLWICDWISFLVLWVLYVIRLEIGILWGWFVWVGWFFGVCWWVVWYVCLCGVVWLVLRICWCLCDMGSGVVFWLDWICLCRDLIFWCYGWVCVLFVWWCCVVWCWRSGVWDGNEWLVCVWVVFFMVCWWRWFVLGFVWYGMCCENEWELVSFVNEVCMNE